MSGAYIPIPNEEYLDSMSYSFLFDELANEFSKDPEKNLKFLLAAEEMCNCLYLTRGILTLNDVLVCLGLYRLRSREYSRVGWNKRYGVHHISFNIFNDRNRRFVNGYEPVALITLECDGPVRCRYFT